MSKLHSVRLNEEKCVGCTNCIKKCPTEAIRVRNGKARIAEERCIDCGECIKACPHHAKSAQMDTLDMLGNFRYNIALAAPSLYAQFGTPATRVMVLAALRNIGFDDVYEVALGAEIVTKSTTEYLQKARLEHKLPLISTACPAVVRVIQEKYPGLLDNLVPYDSPMEVTAGIARREALEKTSFKSEEIGIFFISPCAAKRTAVTNPIGCRPTQVDGVISFAEAYPQILVKLEKLTSEQVNEVERRMLADSYGVRWGYSGGEAIGLQIEKYLAVDGILNVVAILEEIENERLRDIEFIEANSCMGGCIGGPLTVANRYSAKSRLNRYVREADDFEKVHPEAIFKADRVELEPWPSSPEPNNALKLDPDIFKALEKYEQMEIITHNLPGLDCGACGAPDCAALAEDIVRGLAVESDCIFKLKERIRSVVAQMSELETELNRHALPGGIITMKTLDQIVKALEFEVLVEGDLSTREVKSGYACDMLSWVMAHAQPTDIWMTILNSINVIAVAVLTECACVLLTEHVELPEDVAARARDKNVIVLRTRWSTYEACAKLADLLG